MIFDGEVEPCINGGTVALGAYFGVPVDGVVERLLGEQLADGGWNCEAERGSVRSSYHSTICVLDGLAEHERATGALDVSDALRRGEDYLQGRRLFRRLSTGEGVDPSFLLFSFPTQWHYDVLWGLDHLRGRQYHYDVAGDAHFEKSTQRYIHTPHKYHFRFNGKGQPNFRSPTTPMGWFDLARVRIHLHYRR